MSFCITSGMDIGSEKGYKKYGDIFYKFNVCYEPSELLEKKSNNKLRIVKALVFSPKSSELLNININSDILINVLGNYFIIEYDLDNRKITYATDMNASEPLFYYSYGDKFAISDNLWEIVNVIKPTFVDLDVNNIREQALFAYPLFNGTILKNVYYASPATINVYNMDTKLTISNRYYQIEYLPTGNISLNQAIEKMDQILNKAFKQIKKRYPDKVFGVGLSGGLDSRIIPHYALQNGMKLKSFIIGEKKPRKLFLSRDHKSARQLSQIYKLDHVELEYNSLSFEKKQLIDIKQNPSGGSQIFIINKDQFNFDILLTGASGMIVGSEIPVNINSASDDQLLQMILCHCSKIRYVSLFRDRVNRVMKELFNIKWENKVNNPSWITRIDPEKTRETAQEKIKTFIYDRKKHSSANLDIFEEYFIYFLGSRNRYGAFESISGRKKAVSIWFPFMFKETMNWKKEWFLDRKALKQLICIKTPEVKNIRSQNHQLAIGEVDKLKIKKIIALIEFLIRGGGTGGNERWVNRREFKYFSDKVMANNTQWFYNIFDIANVYKTIRKEQPRFFEHLVKIKGVLDVIEKNEYIDFL